VKEETESRLRVLFALVNDRILIEQTAVGVAAKIIEPEFVENAKQLPPTFEDKISLIKFLITGGYIQKDLGSSAINRVVEQDLVGLTNIQANDDGSIPRGMFTIEMKNYLGTHGASSVAQVADFISKKYGIDYTRCYKAVGNNLSHWVASEKVVKTPDRKYELVDGAARTYPDSKTTVYDGRVETEVK
jgi:hypothetical protein